MKRKVVQQGPATLMISLPAKWVKENNITKGIELEITLEKNLLTIRTEGKKIKKVKEYDVTGFSTNTISSLVSAPYKMGYDQITLTYKKDIQKGFVQQFAMEHFPSFVVMEQTPTSCKIRSISEEMASEFTPTLRRAYRVTLAMGESLVAMLREKNYKELKTVNSHELTNNILTNFCERIINRFGYEEPEKNTFMYALVWNLEKLCDDYKYIANFMNKANPKQTHLKKEVIDFIEECNELLREYYQIFFDYDIEKLDANMIRIKAAKKKVLDLMKDKSYEEIIILHYLSGFLLKLYDNKGCTIAVYS